MTSVRFPWLILFSSKAIHIVTQCLWSLRIVNVWLHKILAINIQYFRDTKSKILTDYKSHQSEGSMANFTSKFIPMSQVLKESPTST